MGKIVVSENISLDGVMEDPTGEEGFTHGGWFDRISAHDREAWAKLEHDEALRADALLLGRRSDAYFGSRWNDRPGDWAERLNALPKYVVSTTLTDAVWVNSTILTGSVPDEVEALKATYDGDVVVYASGQLVRTLLSLDLVDELRLTLFPCALGTGDRIFTETMGRRTTRPIAAHLVGDGLVHLAFEVVHDR